MANMGTKEASIKWDIPQKVIQRWCREGKIYPQPTQDAKSSPWHIEEHASFPNYKKLNKKGLFN